MNLLSLSCIASFPHSLLLGPARMITLPETNIVPQNSWLEVFGRRSFPFGIPDFQGRTVIFRECTISFRFFFHIAFPQLSPVQTFFLPSARPLLSVSYSCHLSTALRLRSS